MGEDSANHTADERIRRLHDWMVRCMVGKSLAPERYWELFCQQLVSSGLPLVRFACVVPTVHPLFRAVVYIWERGSGIRRIDAAHGAEQESDFRASPWPRVLEQRSRVRQRLARGDRDYSISSFLAEAGATDYYALPARYGVNLIIGLSFATDGPAGFSEQDIELLEHVAPTVALLVRAAGADHVISVLLETYLGKLPAKRVIRGAIKRGEGERVHAVVWMSDLRGFTAMTDAASGEQVIARLNSYFEQVVGAVERHGGDVLKLIGDGALAIFEGDDPARSAAAAATDLLNALDRDLVAGVTIHAGDLVLGNIGSKSRLDFTVIGPAVNVVSRMQAHCPRDRPGVLLSAEVARACGSPVRSIGSHELRGVSQPMELFELEPVHS